MSEICYEPSQIFQPSRARAAPSWLGPPIRLLRSCPVFDALGVGREALRLGVGWLWCGGLHGSRCRRCRACCSGILTAVKRRQRPSGAPQAPSSPEPAERPQERPQARETPPQAPQKPPKPIRTKKALTDRFKTRLDERLAENERKQAEKQAEPDMEETWDLSDPADPLNIGMGWGTGGHGLGL